MKKSLAYKIVFILLTLIVVGHISFSQTTGVTDTIITGAVIYNGDTLEAKTLDDVVVNGKLTPEQLARLASWTRLRNAIYVTYPYAKRAGALMNEMNAKLATIAEKDDKKEYIKSREKELKKEFTTPLTNLSVYQGRVLMKLINRETGNNCYEIIKEYKGGVMARFYQTIAFFFNSSLKQPYDPTGEDAEIEKIVQEVQRMYGYQSS
ncbi:MAG: DUF4294 domain-containing protein [Chitinophagaceae bacterium]|nr:DUF4294 domain-containing protein [Chitinophagaceae bacterium]